MIQLELRKKKNATQEKNAIFPADLRYILTSVSTEIAGKSLFPSFAPHMELLSSLSLADRVFRQKEATLEWKDGGWKVSLQLSTGHRTYAELVFMQGVKENEFEVQLFLPLVKEEQFEETLSILRSSALHRERFLRLMLFAVDFRGSEAVLSSLSNLVFRQGEVN